MLYRLVTGLYPVPGRSVKDISGKHERRERMLLRDVRPNLPESFVQLIERATASVLEARYETATTMKAAFAATLVKPAQSSRRSTRLTWFGGAAALLGLTPGGRYVSIVGLAVLDAQRMDAAHELPRFGDAAGPVGRRADADVNPRARLVSLAGANLCEGVA